MMTLAADSIDGEHQRPAGDRIEHDLLEILQADEGVAGDLEVVVDEDDPDREEQRIDREREDEERPPARRAAI